MTPSAPPHPTTSYDLEGGKGAVEPFMLKGAERALACSRRGHTGSGLLPTGGRGGPRLAPAGGGEGGGRSAGRRPGARPTPPGGAPRAGQAGLSGSPPRAPASSPVRGHGPDPAARRGPHLPSWHQAPSAAPPLTGCATGRSSHRARAPLFGGLGSGQEQSLQVNRSQSVAPSGCPSPSGPSKALGGQGSSWARQARRRPSGLSRHGVTPRGRGARRPGRGVRGAVPGAGPTSFQPGCPLRPLLTRPRLPLRGALTPETTGIRAVTPRLYLPHHVAEIGRWPTWPDTGGCHPLKMLLSRGLERSRSVAAGLTQEQKWVRHSTVSRVPSSALPSR